MALSLGRTLTTLALTAGLAVASAGPASAQTLKHVDQRGDVRSSTMESEETAPAPTVDNGDIVRTVLKHARNRVSVRVKFADLRRVGFRGDGIRVVTNEGVRRQVSVFAGQRMWRGQAEMYRPASGTPVDCDLAHKIDYDKNVVAVSFPRSCVSDPRWVRLGVGAFWVRSDEEEGYLDDAQLDDRIKERLHLSPRLRRG